MSHGKSSPQNLSTENFAAQGGREATEDASAAPEDGDVRGQEQADCETMHHFFSCISATGEDEAPRVEDAVAVLKEPAADSGAIPAQPAAAESRKREGDKRASGSAGKERRETLKEVVARGGSLHSGYKVLDRLEQQGSAVSAKFFSLLMSLCVANIRTGRATLADAYGVLQRCRESHVEPDTIIYNALLAAVSQEASRGRASLSDATSVMQQLREAGLQADVRTMNTLMDITAKVEGLRLRAEG